MPAAAISRVGGDDPRRRCAAEVGGSAAPGRSPPQGDEPVEAEDDPGGQQPLGDTRPHQQRQATDQEQALGQQRATLPTAPQRLQVKGCHKRRILGRAGGFDFIEHPLLVLGECHLADDLP